jgi:hypothetical protein
MAYYVLYSEDLSLVGVTTEGVVGINGVSVIDFEGQVPNLNKVRWDKDSLSLVPNTTKHTTFEFMTRFTSDERIAIRNSNDDKVKDFIFMIDLADTIYTDDETIIESIGYLVSVNLLTEERATEILA